MNNIYKAFLTSLYLLALASLIYLLQSQLSKKQKEKLLIYYPQFLKSVILFWVHLFLLPLVVKGAPSRSSSPMRDQNLAVVQHSDPKVSKSTTSEVSKSKSQVENPGHPGNTTGEVEVLRNETEVATRAIPSQPLPGLLAGRASFPRNEGIARGVITQQPETRTPAAGMIFPREVREQVVPGTQVDSVSNPGSLPPLLRELFVPYVKAAARDILTSGNPQEVGVSTLPGNPQANQVLNPDLLNDPVTRVLNIAYNNFWNDVATTSSDTTLLLADFYNAVAHAKPSTRPLMHLMLLNPQYGTSPLNYSVAVYLRRFGQKPLSQDPDFSPSMPKMRKKLNLLLKKHEEYQADKEKMGDQIPLVIQTSFPNKLDQFSRIFDDSGALFTFLNGMSPDAGKEVRVQLPCLKLFEPENTPQSHKQASKIVGTMFNDHFRTDLFRTDLAYIEMLNQRPIKDLAKSGHKRKVEGNAFKSGKKAKASNNPSLQDVAAGSSNPSLQDVAAGSSNPSLQDVAAGSSNPSLQDMAAGSSNPPLQDMAAGSSNPPLQDMAAIAAGSSNPPLQDMAAIAAGSSNPPLQDIAGIAAGSNPPLQDIAAGSSNPPLQNIAATSDGISLDDMTDDDIEKYISFLKAYIAPF